MRVDHQHADHVAVAEQRGHGGLELLLHGCLEIDGRFACYRASERKKRDRDRKRSTKKRIAKVASTPTAAIRYDPRRKRENAKEDSRLRKRQSAHVLHKSSCSFVCRCCCFFSRSRPQHTRAPRRISHTHKHTNTPCCGRCSGSARPSTLCSVSPYRSIRHTFRTRRTCLRQ